jgi:preprotein translocase subunit SecG
MDLVITLLYFLFILASVVLIVVILLQEGKGGGFGQALGTSGQETFGAGSRGINTFTAVVVGVFLASAMLIHVMNRIKGQRSETEGFMTPSGSVFDNLPPAAGGSSALPPAGGGTPPPPAGGGTGSPNDGK